MCVCVCVCVCVSSLCLAPLGQNQAWPLEARPGTVHKPRTRGEPAQRAPRTVAILVGILPLFKLFITCFILSYRFHCDHPATWSLTPVCSCAPAPEFVFSGQRLELVCVASRGMVMRRQGNQAEYRAAEMGGGSQRFQQYPLVQQQNASARAEFYDTRAARYREISFQHSTQQGMCGV